MGKTLGDPAEIIRGLRKALAVAQEENRSHRGLRSENARLKKKIELLESMVKLPKDQDELASAGNKLSATSGSTSWNTPIVTPTNIRRSMGRSITMYGYRYAYHDGELIQLNTRFSRISSRPTYMHPTQASEAKVGSDRDNY